MKYQTLFSGTCKESNIILSPAVFAQSCWFKRQDTLGRFSAIVNKRDNLCDFRFFAFLHTKPILKGSLL